MRQSEPDIAFVRVTPRILPLRYHGLRRDFGDVSRQFAIVTGASTGSVGSWRNVAREMALIF
jgi:hypothetical protein